MLQCEEQLKKHQRHRQMCYSLVILWLWELQKPFKTSGTEFYSELSSTKQQCTCIKEALPLRRRDLRKHEAEDPGAQIQFQEALQAQAARVEPSHLQAYRTKDGPSADPLGGYNVKLRHFIRMHRIRCAQIHLQQQMGENEQIIRIFSGLCYTSELI